MIKSSILYRKAIMLFTGDSCEDTTNGVVLICIGGGVALLFEAIGEPLLLSS